MKEKFYQRKGFIPTLITSLLIIGILILIQDYTYLFMSERHIKILGGGGGAILALGLLFRWKFARVLLSMITLILALITLTHFFKKESVLLLPSILLLLGLITSFYLLIGSKSVKLYIEGE